MTKSLDQQRKSAGSPFGLLGRKLGHSWSPRIHTTLGSVPYDLFEREPDEVEAFIRKGTWRGVNVTIPYKCDAARLADERSPRVERLGAANTLVRRPDGTIYAENTDVLGFSLMLQRFCERRLGTTAEELLSGKPALVLGSGGGQRGRPGGARGRRGARLRHLALWHRHIRDAGGAPRGRGSHGERNPGWDVPQLPCDARARR
jgi:shikimate dehydrogenase